MSTTTKELKARYTVATVITNDKEFAERVKENIKKMGVTHEDVYRRGFNEYEQDLIKINS